MRVLITGGAGFIGRYAARLCLLQGHNVVVLDNFSQQIHGTRPVEELEEEFRSFVGGRAQSSDDSLTIVRADVRDEATLERVLQQQDAVVHLAAETGTGQSMYEVVRYEQVNIGGTAALLQCLAGGRSPSVRKLVLASSRAIYGEGKYRCERCGVVYPATRSAQAMESGQFEPLCPRCHTPCTALPTDENTPACPASFYGLTKHVQEQMVSLFARTLGINADILRFQNVYGPGQSLRNPYTGILAIFSNAARANKVINIFEDGNESRDFVYVEDVAWATCRCLESDMRSVNVFNVGSGEAVAVKEVASQIKDYFRSESPLHVSGEFRLGDIRHNFASLDRLGSAVGYEPRVNFRDGLSRFLAWAQAQPVEADRYEESIEEMRNKGLAGVSKA